MTQTVITTIKDTSYALRCNEPYKEKYHQI